MKDFHFEISEVFAMPQRPPGTETWAFSKTPFPGIAFGLVDGKWEQCFFDGKNLDTLAGTILPYEFPPMFLLLPQAGAEIKAPGPHREWKTIAHCPECGVIATVVCGVDHLRHQDYFYAMCPKDGQIGPKTDNAEEALMRVARQKVFRTWIPEQLDSAVVAVAAPDGHAAAVMRANQEIGLDPGKHRGEQLKITVQEIGKPSFTYEVEVRDRPMMCVVGP